MRESIKKPWKYMVGLHTAIMIYTLSTVAAKLAADTVMFSKEFFLFYGLEIIILGTYAVVWQQIVKHFELSVAYANKGVALVWAVLWAVIVFREEITVRNLIGVGVVLIGIVLVNYHE